MKITREQLKQIIKEELEEATKKSPASQLSGIGFEIDDLINKTTRLLIDTEMDADMRSTAIGIVDQIRDDVKKRYRQIAYYVQSAAEK